MGGDMAEKKKRLCYTYPVLQPGDPLPGQIPQEAPAEHDPDTNGEWDPLPHKYTGPDPWDGTEPLFRELSVVGLNGAEEDAVISSNRASDLLERRLCQRSLYLVDGQRPDPAFGVEVLWNRCPPMIRELWLLAYNRHNAVMQELAVTFLAGCSVGRR